MQASPHPPSASLQPTVSVCLAVRRAAGLLPLFLRGLDAQKQVRVELIASCAGDDLATRVWLTQRAHETAGWIVLDGQTGQAEGVDGGKASASSVARADYIAFLDADIELIQPNTLAQAIGWLQEDPRLAGVVPAPCARPSDPPAVRLAALVGADPLLAWKSLDALIPLNASTPFLFPLRLPGGEQIMCGGNAFIMRRSDLWAAGGFDHDVALLRRLLASGKDRVGVLPASMIHRTASTFTGWIAKRVTTAQRHFSRPASDFPFEGETFKQRILFWAKVLGHLAILPDLPLAWRRWRESGDLVAWLYPPMALASLVATCLGWCLRKRTAPPVSSISLASSQQLQPDQISIVIACTPGAPNPAADWLRQFPEIELIIESGLHPSVSRNQGVLRASRPFVVFLNAHAVPRHDWLDQLCAAWRQDDDALAGPQDTSSAEAPFARASGLALSCPWITGPFAHRYHLDGAACPATSRNSTSTNLAIRRDKWFPFDESLYPFEDTDWMAKAQARGYRMRWLPALVVFNTRRPTMGALGSQLFGYGLARARCRRLSVLSAWGGVIVAIWMMWHLPWISGIVLMAMCGCAWLQMAQRAGVASASRALFLAPAIWSSYLAGLLIGRWLSRHLLKNPAKHT